MAGWRGHAGKGRKLRRAPDVEVDVQIDLGWHFPPKLFLTFCSSHPPPWPPLNGYTHVRLPGSHMSYRPSLSGGGLVSHGVVGFDLKFWEVIPDEHGGRASGPPTSVRTFKRQLLRVYEPCSYQNTIRTHPVLATNRPRRTHTQPRTSAKNPA